MSEPFIGGPFMGWTMYGVDHLWEWTIYGGTIYGWTIYGVDHLWGGPFMEWTIYGSGLFMEDPFMNAPFTGVNQLWGRPIRFLDTISYRCHF